MTIDEAKIKIEELACYARTKGWDDEYTEAVNMAVKALEQQPCDDCISRESIIEIVNHQRFGMSKIAFGIITEKVIELPPVTPRPKMGKWIRMKAYEKWECSECHTAFRFTFKEHDYCPNCGCKMQEVEG